MTGTVITFYSYKGGVGRSFALANIAVLLARWGHRVLTIDWDLEAPGLDRYFASMTPSPPDAGVIDLAYDFLAGATEPESYQVRLKDVDGTIALLAAGRRDDRYSGLVHGIDWADLYDRGFADFLERCREVWTQDYDFVLIDSRTGISDIAGICTAHLPDQLVVLFTANNQSVDGVMDIARYADAARDRLPYDRQPHLVLPILSRFDNRVEYERAESWHRRCAETTAPLFRNWLAKDVPENLMLRHLTLPYVSYWSFGEQLPVQGERTPAADQISFALETVAAVIAQRFERTDLLADNRDAYVAAARTRRRSYELDLVVSSPRTVLDVTTVLIDELRALGLRVDRSVSSGVPDFLVRTSRSARNLCLVVDGTVSPWQLTEAEQFLRHALDADGDRQLLCVLTRDTDHALLPAFLRNLQYSRLDSGMRSPQVARQLYEAVTRAAPDRADTDRHAVRDAASALRRVPSEAHRGRWALIERTVHDMNDALEDGDLASLQDLTVDLELLNDVRTDRAGFTVPSGLRGRIDALLARIER